MAESFDVYSLTSFSSRQGCGREVDLPGGTWRNEYLVFHGDQMYTTNSSAGFYIYVTYLRKLFLKTVNSWCSFILFSLECQLCKCATVISQVFSTNNKVKADILLIQLLLYKKRSFDLWKCNVLFASTYFKVLCHQEKTQFFNLLYKCI